MNRIINPFYKLNDKNVFTLREEDYARIMEDVRLILKVAEEAGFKIEELEIKEGRMMAAELSYTLKDTLSIKLEKNGRLIDLSIAIPHLIDNNFIFINGKRKIPFFQLYDIPVIYRKGNIKLRTSVASITITSRNSKTPHVLMSFMGKYLPLADICFACFSKSEIEEIFEEELNNVGNLNGIRYLLILDLIKNMVQPLEKVAYIKMLGRNFSESFPAAKGDSLVYALNILLKCDIMSSRLLGSDSILLEIIKAIRSKPLDDTDLINKRIRCFEYVITARVAKIIYDLCVTTKRLSKPKFNTNSAQVINACNVSDIIQFDFCINPIEELTKLSRCTLIGPGGFNKDNVPAYLRDISESIFGRICPADTPDRENCGVQQSLIVNPNLDDNLKFGKENENDPISVAISMVPFLEHDDQTRLQMSASQMRQAVMLQKFDVPLIRSGCECLYSKHTSFCSIAEEDGEILFSNSKFFIVKYDSSGKVRVFWWGPRNTYTENIDFGSFLYKVGDKFKKGDILSESNYMNDGSICFGKNLLTSVMAYYGYNYEDSIVVSDKLVKEGSLTSIHFRDMSFRIPPDKVLLSLNKYGEPLKFLPNIYEIVQSGQTYARMKQISSSSSYDIFREETELKAHKNLQVFERKIYVNDYNSDIMEYVEWVQKIMEQQRDEERKLQECLIEILGNKDAMDIIKRYGLNKFLTDHHKIKGEEFPGIFVQMYGFYRRPIEVGDKVGNRHGNKGVISRIVEEEKMPKMTDGRHVDIIVNPMGFISRMNTGQQFELHLAMSVVDLKNKMKEMLLKGESQELIKTYLLEYIKKIDVTKHSWYFNQFQWLLRDITIDEKFIDELTVIQPPFESVNIERLKDALIHTNTKHKFKLYDPISKKFFQEPIAVGYNYFFKMIHIAEEKMSARGIGLYNRRTLQPLSGKKSKGGQRMGEMEFHSLIAHEGEHTVDECATTKSDCIDKKNKYITETITSEDISYILDEADFEEKGESIMLLEAWLLQIGVKR